MANVTSGMNFILNNNSTNQLTLISKEITGSSSTIVLQLPQTLEPNSINKECKTNPSDTPYTVKWSYSPDNGNTLLNFECDLSGENGININPSVTGTGANNWLLGEIPSLVGDTWTIGFAYSPVLTNFTFTVPADVANMGVYAGIFGQIINQDYTNIFGTTLSKGTNVHFNGIDYFANPNSGNLPMITLCQPKSSFSAPQTFTIKLTNAYITGGIIAISVGSSMVLPFNNDKTVATPTPNTNPKDIFGLIEFANRQNKGLDVDISFVDQVGFPFTLTTTPQPPSPAQDGVGIPLSRTALFTLAKNNPDFQTGFFNECITKGQPYRLEAPQDILSASENIAPALQAPLGKPYGKLPLTTQYWYVVAAVNKSGASNQSNPQNFKAHPGSSGGKNVNFQTAVLTWQAFPNAVSYNVYRCTSSEVPLTSGYGLLQSGITTTTFTDDGSLSPNMKIQPPTCNYGYNPLHLYFDKAILDFFNKFTASNSFNIVVDGTTWTGNTITNKPSTDPQKPYTVLQLTGSDNVGTVNIYQPFFFENTNNSIYPPAPSWLPDRFESPTQMVFSCDGVFASAQDPDTPAGINIKDIENPIVSALNRGIAKSVDPKNWGDPTQFYPSSDTPSNLYAKFLHQNYTLNPTTGVSINGLAYGFPYDDQSGQSSNIQLLPIPTSVNISISPFNETE